MHPEAPLPSDEVAVAAWLRPRLIPGFGALVGRMVPTGYEAFARILHPAADRYGYSVRWSEVAGLTGRTVHPLVQWHKLVDAEDSFGEGGLCPGDPPFRGELPRAELEALIDVLRRHTPAPGDCWFCWDVHGHADGRHSASEVVGTGDSDEPTTAAPPPTPVSRTYPRVRIGGLRYLLAHGPLASALFIGRWTGRMDTFLPEAPAIWWPDDRSWCVGSLMDIDSTVVGGSARLIEEILTDPRLEAFPVAADDSLMDDGDRIN